LDLLELLPAQSHYSGIPEKCDYVFSPQGMVALVEGHSSLWEYVEKD
jgi:hypothetical protein